MRKTIGLFVGVLALASCQSSDVYDEQAVKELEAQSVAKNAAEIFGTIDPKQDWNSVTKGSVNVTANADLQDIVKVQILTESPFFNNGARVLNEAKVSNDETVNLVYDAPNIYKRLVAACVDKNGVYYIKGFDIGDQEVNFQSAASARATRGEADASYGFPEPSNFTMPFEKSYMSYNAARTIRSEVGDYSYEYVNLWNGSGWEKERMWRNNSTLDQNSGDYKKTYDGSAWYLQNFSIRRDIANNIDEEEKSQLETIFNSLLYWKNDKKSNLQKNNLELIRNSEIVKLYNNHMIATGKPVILTPVQATSNEIAYCDLYYYYYNPDEIAGMTEDQEVQFIKSLPKYMAMSCGDAMLVKSGSSEFYKNYEYVLPYYGEHTAFEGVIKEGFATDGKVYRIRNGFQVEGVKYYMSYGPEKDSEYMATKKGDNDTDVALQLWQIFKNDKGICYLYNLGRRCFIQNDLNNNWHLTWSASDLLVNSVAPYIISEDTNGAYHFSGTVKDQPAKGLMLGTDLDKSGDKFNIGLWADKNADNGTCDWYLEEYTGTKELAVKEELRELTTENCAQSFIIPKGYRIGFLLKKAMDNHADVYNNYKNKSYNLKRNGEVYADGRLNKQINNYPDHFSKATTEFTMADDDPRAAIFSANNKSYLTLEDGSDCNFVDMIIEMSNGIEVVNEKIEPEAEAYTLCFEDRPSTADYDLNDVVIRGVRKDRTTLEISLVATGADDEVYIHNALGNQEVHKIIGVDSPDSNGHFFANTEVGGTVKEPVTVTVQVEAGTSITDFLKEIYIENRTMGLEVHVAKEGEPPYGIIVPLDFSYPAERVSIIDAYPKFKNWANDRTVDTDWYLYPEGDTYPNPFAKQ